MTAYYNEFDKKAAAWIRELIKEGLIAPGDVDERSITDVRPDDLVGYTQCHFFAGVAGWSIAARLAGWPDDRPMWSASCPCQPFSVAGKGAGAADERHLWPDFFRLVRARRPAFIVGEQVAAAVGKDWFTGVRSDLESIGYVGRGVVVPACAVGAPHRRDRLWFVAGSGVVGDVHDQGSQGHAGHESGAVGWPQQDRPATETGGGDDGGLLEHTESIRRREGRPEPELRSGWPAIAGTGIPCSDNRSLADAVGGQHKPSSSRADQWAVAGCNGKGNAICNVADSNGRHASTEREQRGWEQRQQQEDGGAGAWDGARWLIGHDGKARRVEPGIPLLVDGLPNRASLLRGYGNAIVPQLAAEVIGAWMDCAGDMA